ncbi:MAG: hypothetical protein R6X02_21985 [Enhygromyxa sp.]
MAKSDTQFEDGPAQLFPAPDTLAAHVVDWRDGGAIHGFGVVDDLALHFAPHEVFLLGLLGEEATAEHGRAFGVALTWLAACHVGLAPTHSAVLARVSGAPTSAIIATSAMVAAREAEFELARHRSLLDWLDSSPREDFTGWSERDPRWRERLARACALDLPELELARDSISAALIVFHAVGLRQPKHLLAAWAWARMIGSLAESLADAGLDIHSYPLRLPPFDYEEGP